MEFKEQVKLLSAESTPYKMAGNEGVSHKLRFNINDEIFVCNSSAEQVAEFKHFVGKTGDATFKLSSRKENLRMELVSFDA